MSEKVIVSVNEGKIRGFKKKSIYSEVEYLSFLGIPYGQSTAGQARFKEPSKAKPRNGILDATTEKEGCIQYSLLQKMRVCGSEDCLYNNIYTTEIPKKGDALKAVIVSIHPGGYYHGSPDPSHYGSPEYFIHRDIVYVGIAYRLSILGGLNLNTKDCSGNQNLKDIILSLQWIKSNISNFGGDPENVTIMGSSSGASIVHHLLTSPLAKGLYHKAVLMGMYNFSPPIIMPTENFTTAYKIGLDLGYDGEQDDHRKLLMFYKNLPMFRLIAFRPEQLFKKTLLPVYPSSPFMPTYENPKTSRNPVIPLPPEELIPSTKRVPLMVGFCEREAIMGLDMAYEKTLEESFYSVLRQNKSGWGKNLTDDDLKEIQQQVESFYTNGCSIESASLTTKCDVLTDISLSDVYDTLIDVVSDDLPSSVYVYKFQYDGKLDFMKLKSAHSLSTAVRGAYHAADFSYWNYIEETAGKNLERVTSKDREIIDTMTSVITTFAKTGNPNSEELVVNWEPTTRNDPHYLNIDETLEVRNEILNGKRLEFWHKLKRQFKKNT